MSNIIAFPKAEPLFRVKTTVLKYGRYKDVTFHWFYTEATRPRRRALYKVLIKDYDVKEEFIAYSEIALEELFSADEAAALKAYLDAVHGDVGVTVIEPVELPMRKSAPFSFIGAGGGDDYYMLCREPEYNLPFRVRGFFSEREPGPLAAAVAGDGQFPFRSSLRWLCL